MLLLMGDWRYIAQSRMPPDAIVERFNLISNVFHGLLSSFILSCVNPFCY